MQRLNREKDKSKNAALKVGMTKLLHITFEKILYTSFMSLSTPSSRKIMETVDIMTN
jgi:hypothetical protein